MEMDVVIVNKTFLPYGKPCLDDEDVAAVVSVLKGDFLTTGPMVGKFEEKLANQVTSKHAIVCNSGTAALHLAYLALGLSAHDQVIVPAMTFCATANAAAMCGAQVIFADVDAKTGLMTVENLRDALERADPDRVKIVTVVHMNGQMADIVGLRKLTESYGLKLVEDACHALGTTYYAGEKEYSVGQCAHSDLCCFSFHPVKTVAMGEGGAVTTNSLEHANLMSLLRSHGLEFDPAKFEALPSDAVSDAPAWHREMQILGFNYRAPDILCALSSAQLDKINKFKAQRSALTKLYDEKIDCHPTLLKHINRMPDQDPCWHLYPVHIDFKLIGKSREQVVKELLEVNIGTQVHYSPVPSHPYWKRKTIHNSYPGAQEYYEKVLSLPLYCDLTGEQVYYITEQLYRILSPSD